MRRSWNGSIWAGILLAAAAMFYIPVFPVLQGAPGFPWVNLVLFALGILLLGRGLVRAFSEPVRYRGRVFGSVLGGVAVLAVAFFCFGVFYVARQLPASAAAPQTGRRAPDFTLPDQDGKPVSLAHLLAPPRAGDADEKMNGNASGVLLIFYRGHW